jgi:FtsP/CotA-like multicopper oxidase with cupredoxin domain
MTVQSAPASRMRANILIALTAAIAVAVVAVSAWLSSRTPGVVLHATEVDQPVGWDDELALASAADMNPDPAIIEIELEARVETLEILPGVQTAVWTYNGSLPGPLIRAKVGDRLIVHFTNSLPEATTIHWHGIRVPNDMDGAPGFTQDPIQPGEYFRYEFELRDAGTFWYHPHQNSAAQVGRGLYGPIIVTDPDDPEIFGDDLVLVLSDISLDEDGQLQSERSGGGFGDLFGREGSVVLVNGRVQPTLRVRAGKQQRWRIINAARTRYFRLAARGEPFVRLGGDHGLAARSEVLERVLVVPGERVDLVYTPADAPGERYTMRWVPVNRGWGTQTGRVPKDLLHIVTVNERSVTPAAIPQTLKEIPAIDISEAIEHRIEMTIMRAGATTEMGFNNVHHDHARPLVARLGETHVWTIVNDTDFAHPFHLHGYFFQVLDDRRVPEWKDTVDVPAHSELRLAVHFDERPGMWMYHCHILDHADVGMMGHLLVTDDTDERHTESQGHHHQAQ